MRRVYEGLAILMKYGAGEGSLSAEHDVIYAGIGPDRAVKDDEDRLKELGWHWQEKFECYAIRV